MWGLLMMGAVFTALNPVRLAVIALLISRPRPVANLFAYWLGAVVFGIPSLLIPLTVLHSTPVLSAITQSMATSPIFRHVQVGMGVLALSIAAWTLVRSASSQRAEVRTPIGASTLVMDPNAAPAIFQRLGRSGDPAMRSRSPIRRLFGHASDAWESGSLWVAALLGMLMGGPSLDGVVMGLAIIVTSGGTTGSQISAAIASVFVMLALVEIILVSSVVAPTKTEAALGLIHDWVQTHRRKILIVLFTVVGIALVAQGLGVI